MDTSIEARGFHPVALPAHLRVSAAERLVEGTPEQVRRTARRLVAAGGDGGLSFHHAFATIDPRPHTAPDHTLAPPASDAPAPSNAHAATRSATATARRLAVAGGPAVRELALAIPAPGRSAMVFLSRPARGGPAEPDARGASRPHRHGERVACLRALGAHLAALPGRPVAIAQALPHPSEAWAQAALLEAGWLVVGRLAYLRRPLVGRDADPPAPPALPAGVRVEPVAPPAPGAPCPPGLIEALEASYEDTLDCPGLCGLRRTGDIIASHAAIGRPELAQWRVVYEGSRPLGAVLVACVPEQRCYELVYLGLAPPLRGRGLGGALLAGAIAQVASRLRRGPSGAGWSMTCAVDAANDPAVRLYQRHGFRTSDARVACVLGLEGERR